VDLGPQIYNSVCIFLFYDSLFKLKCKSFLIRCGDTQNFRTYNNYYATENFIKGEYHRNIGVNMAIVASSVAVFSAANLEEGIGEKGVDESGRKSVISLLSPSFIGVAGAAEAAGGYAFPEDEAGISAYVNICQKINLEKAETTFKSIETANESYIIGQIALDGYDPEYVAPHAYVHKDGWIVTYYLKNESSGKIMQWNGYGGGKITTTTLADTIKKVCDAITFNYDRIKDDVKYYDFEYPNANRMMLITEWIKGTGKQSDQFNLTIPIECKLYEGSWSHYCYGYKGTGVYDCHIEYSRVKITDIDYYPTYILSEIKDVYGHGTSYHKYGEFTPKQLNADGTLHIIMVEQAVSYAECESCVATVLIYRTS
jgi:hypothetical protein